MREKTDRLRRLLHEGYRLDDVESDDEAIFATLRRGSDVVRLRFYRSDAPELFQMTRAA